MIAFVDSTSPFQHSVSLFKNKIGLPLLAHEFMILRSCPADLGEYGYTFEGSDWGLVLI